MKNKIFNLVTASIVLWAFFMKMEIENLARTPEFIYTDYYMNDLWYMYIILIGLTAIIVVNAMSIISKFMPAKKEDVVDVVETNEGDIVVEEKDETIES